MSCDEKTHHLKRSSRLSPRTRSTRRYLELYREKLTDLLTGDAVSLYRVGKGAAADEHRERTACDDDVLLMGAKHFDATREGSAKAWAALAAAEGRKRQAATAMNARSSRAHTVFALALAQRDPATDAVLTSKLYCSRRRKSFSHSPRAGVPIAATRPRNIRAASPRL